MNQEIAALSETLNNWARPNELINEGNKIKVIKF